MRDMYNVHVLAAQCQRDRDVVPPEIVFGRLIQLGEVWRQWTQFVQIAIGTDQQVLVVKIYGREIPYKIPNVSSNAELVDLADVDRYAHKGKIGLRPHFPS